MKFWHFYRGTQYTLIEADFSFFFEAGMGSAGMKQEKWDYTRRSGQGMSQQPQVQEDFIANFILPIHGY